MHGLRSLVGRFKLRIHPLAGQESRAVLGDAISAHQAHGFAHHVCAVARVPKLRRRTQHVRFRILQYKLHQRIGRELFARVGRCCTSSETRWRAARFPAALLILRVRPQCRAPPGSRSFVSQSGRVRQTAAPPQSPAMPPPRPSPTHRQACAVHPRAAGCLARSARFPVSRLRLRESVRADTELPAPLPTTIWRRSSGPRSPVSAERPLQLLRRD